MVEEEEELDVDSMGKVNGIAKQKQKEEEEKTMPWQDGRVARATTTTTIQYSIP